MSTGKSVRLFLADGTLGELLTAGRNSNGRVEWKLQLTGVTYGSWQNQAIEQNLGGNES